MFNAIFVYVNFTTFDFRRSMFGILVCNMLAYFIRCTLMSFVFPMLVPPIKKM